jgi:myo-inositol-1(or 4)-monophosphatase
MNNKNLFNLGKEIVNTASAEIVKLSMKKPLGKLIGSKGASGDMTKTADKASEKSAIKTISKFLKVNKGIRIVLISEEIGVLEFGDKKSKEGFFMIMDPLDGSNNLRPWKTPGPVVVISLAIGRLSVLDKKDNFQSIEIGLVKDIFNDRLYYAEKGKGAYVEGFGKIKSSPESDIKKAIVSIDLDLESNDYKKMYFDLRELMENRRFRRRSGSSILDFMKVACGEYDAFVTLGARMKLYDIAAANLIIKESGGVLEFFSEKLSYCIIKKLISTKDKTLLKTVKFKIIASGNKKLQEKIKKYLNL